MIKHVVCFKLNNNTNEEKQAAKDMLMSMVGKVPTILDIEVGTDFLCSARSYDIFLQVTLKSIRILKFLYPLSSLCLSALHLFLLSHL